MKFLKNHKILYLLLVLILSACKNAPNEPEQQPEVEPLTQAQAIKLYFMTPVALNGTFVETDHIMSSWTSEDGVWPANKAVDYNSPTTESVDGMTHRGIMKIRATAPYEQEGAVMTPSFVDYYINDNALTALQVITCKGMNDAGHLVYDVAVSNALLGNQKQLYYSEHTIRERLDERHFSITGWMKEESKVDSIPGYSITIDDQAPMVIAIGDLYPTQGKVQIELETPLSYTWGAFTGKYKSITLEFTGKQGNQYGGSALITFSLGLFTRDFTFTLLMDENGLVPNSLYTE